MSVQLDRLSRVEARQIWTSESADFTPWPAREENLQLLGEAVGLELELEAQERFVGPFRADVLCRDIGSGSWVLVENQLERTDHSHLGQLLTYAAGLKAVTIIWIANPFTEEHRAALDWLNEITDSRFNFFGLEIELWRIGSSPVAPKFNIVSKPNDWARTVSERTQSGDLSDTQQLQVRFWTAFRDFVQTARTPIRPTKPLPQPWMGFAIGRSGFSLSAVASLWNSDIGSYKSNEVRAEVVIAGEHAKAYCALLEVERDQIHRDFGDELIWHNPEDTRQVRIYVRRDALIRDEVTWPELHGWLLENLEKLHGVFSPRVRALQLDPGSAV